MKHPAPLLPRFAIAALALTVAASTAAAHDDGASPPTSGNYRWALYTSCAVAFAVLIVWMIANHRRGGAAAEEMSAIERRLDELEKDGN